MKKILHTVLAFALGLTGVMAQGAGSIDLSFDPGTGFNNAPGQILLQADGKILVAGDFLTYNGVTVSGIVRLNSDGSIDPSFMTGSGFNLGGNPNLVQVMAMALQSDGKILVCGGFSVYNGTSVGTVVRLNADGTLDNTFDASAIAQHNLYNIWVQSTGKIIIGGSFYEGIPGQPQSGFYYIRLNTDGSFDPTFQYLYSMIGMSNEDKIYTAEKYFDESLSENRSNIVKLGPDGIADPNDLFVFPQSPLYAAHGYGDDVQGLRFLSETKMIAFGYFNDLIDTTDVTTPRIGIIDQELYGNDPIFNPGTGFDDSPETVEYDAASNKMVAAGIFVSYNEAPVNKVVRLNMDGTLDNTFQTGTGFPPGNGVAPYIICFQPDGKIIVGGRFISYDGVLRNNIVRLNGDIATSIASQDDQPTTIYPNPSNGLYRIAANDIKEYRVFDAMGKMVLTNTNVADNKVIDLSTEPNGIYILQVISENGQATQKLVKQ